MKSQKTSASLTAHRRTIWQNKAVWVLIIVLLLGGGSFWYWGIGAAQAKSTAQLGPATNTTTVKSGDISISASGSGTLIASQSVDLSFSTSGTVAGLSIKVGDQVKAGDVLAWLENTQTLDANLATAQLALLEAQQNLTSLQKNANLSLAQAYADLVTAQQSYNDAVKTDQRTAYARCSQEVNTKYSAALEQATKKLNELTKTTYGSDEWITARNDYDTAQANYNYCITYTADEKTSAKSTVEVAKTALQQAQDTYDTLKSASGIDPTQLAIDEAKVNQAQAQVTKAEEALAGVVLKAPIDGKVTYLAAGAGTKVDTSKFITISDVSQPALTVSVDETDMDKLVVGNQATVTFDALPDLTFTGRVTRVDPQLTTSGQYKVATGQVELDTDAAKTLSSLPLGLNATITIVSQQAKGVLLVPVTALKDLGNEYAVMLVGSDGQMSQQAVQVGLKDSTSAEITSGLKEGDLVSTSAVQTKSSSTSSSTNTKNTSGASGGQPMDGGGMMPPGQ
jgi:HlyD family secretion protein